MGTLENEDTIFEVVDTRKGANNTIKHIGFVKRGKISVNDKLESKVNKEIRMASARNHTATHLLHEALKEVLGDHVNQAGSLVTPERLRFDVTHFEPISKEELKIVEEKVNTAILDALHINCEIYEYKRCKRKRSYGTLWRKVW